MIQRERLLATLLDLVRIPSPSSQEERVAEAIAQRLRSWGLQPRRDAIGNLWARLEGEGEPLVLTAHMDTVGPAVQINPVLRDGVIYSDGTTILGADDKAGIAIILEVLAVLRERGLRHRPIEVLFTVQEETGLHGAKQFDLSQLEAKMCLGLDSGGDPGTIIVSAPAQDSLRAAIHGRSAHAGVNPEAGINAIRVAAEAIVAMPLGRIDAETTANIGIISGGSATNIVPDLVTLRGEARSRNAAKLEAQTRAMVAALERAAQAHGAKAEIEVRREYEAYHLDGDSPIFALVSAAMRSLNIEPRPIPTGGGSDANVFNAAGLATVQLSAGMAEVHTPQEHVALEDMVTAAKIILACVRL
jgi:tripeptide aminopeptidase